MLDLARVRRDTPRDILNVLVEGLDSVKVNRPLSLAKAYEDDTLLAYAFNGDPVPPDHGFPVRAIVPGWVGINNVKWVGRIEVRTSVIDVPTTTKTYVLEGPDYPTKVVLRQQTIKSAVALPWGATLPAGWQRVRGFAWSPVGRISRVEYSLDRGATWQPSALREPNIARAWTRWDFEWNARPGDHVILTRAVDEQGTRSRPASRGTLRATATTCRYRIRSRCPDTGTPPVRRPPMTRRVRRGCPGWGDLAPASNHRES